MEFLTIYGDGKINLNTAQPLVLSSFSDDIDKEMIDALIIYRDQDVQALEDIFWYKDALGTEEDIFDQELITTSSHYFEIESRGVLGDMSSAVKCAVKREGKDCRIMKWNDF